MNKKQGLIKKKNSPIGPIPINNNPTTAYLHVPNIYTAFVAHAESGYIFEGESHNFWEIVYVLDGTIGIMSGSSILTLRKNEFFLHTPYEFHRIWSTDRAGAKYLIVSFDLTGSGTVFLKDRSFKISNAHYNHILDMTDYIMTSNLRKQFPLLTVFDLNLEREPQFTCFANALTLLLAKSTNTSTYNTKNQDDTAILFEKAVKYMKSHLDVNLSNGEIAYNTNTSVSTLKRIFNAYSSLGVHEYFLELKITQAKKLLDDGLSVREVSEQLGFSNQNNFSATFKRMTGLAPSKYASSSEYRSPNENDT